MIAMSIAYGYSPSSSRELLETSGNWLFRKKNSNIKKAKYSNYLLKIFCDEVWKQLTCVAGKQASSSLPPAPDVDSLVSRRI